MDANHLELIRAELRSARDRLRAARILLDEKLVPDAISRAYYAVFHGSRALLIHRGIQVHTHSGLKSMFGLHIIERGVVDRRLGKILEALMDRRESSDYDVWQALDTEDARDCMELAQEFLAAIECRLMEDGVEV